MARETIPEAWIGRSIAVTLDVRTPEEFTGKLDEVNDRGIVLTIGAGSQNEALVFYPWNSIRRLRLGEAGSQPKKEPGKRLAGDPGWFS